MGRIAGPYGVRGWMRVAGASEALAAVPVWWIGGRDYRVEATRIHSGTLLAKLAGIETPEQARSLKGEAVRVPRRLLPEPEEGIYYHADLAGMDVVNAEGVFLGTVKALASNGAHEVVELAGNRTRLLPWVPAVVKRVDLARRRIEVDWGTDW